MKIFAEKVLGGETVGMLLAILCPPLSESDV